MEQYNEELEKNLLEMVKQKEISDKRLVSLEIVIGALSMIILLSPVVIAAYLPMQAWLRIDVIVSGIIPFIIGIGFAIRIEQIAGYYECAKCGHRYVLTYGIVLWAMHHNRTRYMKCPKCGKISWNKKVISKD